MNEIAVNLNFNATTKDELLFYSKDNSYSVCQAGFEQTHNLTSVLYFDY